MAWQVCFCCSGWEAVIQKAALPCRCLAFRQFSASTRPSQPTDAQWLFLDDAERSHLLCGRHGWWHALRRAVRKMTFVSSPLPACRSW
jgi:hypothetical protein